MRPSDAPPRRLKTLVRSSGDLATLGDFAPHACPRPASSQWQTLAGRTETQGLPGACLRGTLPGAASTIGIAPSGQLSLCPTSGSPLEAPPHGQDGSRIREV